MSGSISFDTDSPVELVLRVTLDVYPLLELAVAQDSMYLLATGVRWANGSVFMVVKVWFIARF